jgi:hypothetical protein
LRRPKKRAYNGQVPEPIALAGRFLHWIIRLAHETKMPQKFEKTPQKFEWKQKLRPKPQASAPSDGAESGLMRDKVAVPDPATVPLPTDAEAGGTSTAPAAIETAAQDRERQAIPETPPVTTAEPGRGQDQIPPRSNAVLIAVVIAASAIAAIAAAYLTLPW